MSRPTLQGLAPAPAGEGWLGATLGTFGASRASMAAPGPSGFKPS